MNKKARYQGKLYAGSPKSNRAVHIGEIWVGFGEGLLPRIVTKKHSVVSVSASLMVIAVWIWTLKKQQKEFVALLTGIWEMFSEGKEKGET